MTARDPSEPFDAEVVSRVEIVRRCRAGLEELERAHVYEDHAVWAEVEALIQAAEREGAR